MRDTEIHRRTEKEALQAINDLLDRGFIISYPLTEIKSNSIGRGQYNYQNQNLTWDKVQHHLIGSAE